MLWRPSGRLRTSFSYTFNDIDLPQGDFVTRLVEFRTDVAFSSTLNWVTRLQFDNVSQRAGVNMRLQWVPEAGREAYLVINHNANRDFLQRLDDRFHSEVAEIAIRYSHTVRF